jgi:predicted transcriptional regulator YdeE
MAYDVTIVELPAKRLVGLSARMNMSECGEKCPLVWEKFGPRMSEVKGVVEESSYGVSVNMEENGDLDYWATMAVSPEAPVPAGMSALSLRGGKYALCNSTLDSIGGVYTYIYGEWAQTHPVDFTSACFELYAKNWQEGDPVGVYVPLHS